MIQSVPVVGLFKEKRALSTVIFWTAFFSCLLMVYGLNTWLPKLMIEAGYGLNSSLRFLDCSSRWSDYRYTDYCSSL